MELKNWILLILLGAVWGSAFMFIKISADDFGPILLVNLRLLLAGALFLPFLLRKKYLAHFKSHFPGILILSIFSNAFPFTMFSYASLGATSNILATHFHLPCFPMLHLVPPQICWVFLMAQQPL